MKKKCIISSIIIIFIVLVIIIAFAIYRKNINISVADVELDIENNNESQEVNYDWEWKYDTPENYGINSSNINSLYNRYDFSQVYSTVIIKNDHIINEYYKDGYDKNSIFTSNENNGVNYQGRNSVYWQFMDDLVDICD